MSERQERFERIWAAQHFVQVESLPQHRWITQDGYRDPSMAAHYRTFCLTLDSIEAPPTTLKRIGKACLACGQHHPGGEGMPCPHMQAYS